MGRTPAPTALKLVRGDRKSRIPRNEPKPKVSTEIPDPPDWLVGELACSFWADLTPKVHPLKLLTEADLHSFASLCAMLETQARAYAEVVDGKLVSEGERGDVVSKSWLVLAKASELVIRWSREFGLTPSGRSGITIEPPANDDEARRLLS